MESKILSVLLESTPEIFILGIGIFYLWRYLTSLIESRNKTMNERVDDMKETILFQREENIKALQDLKRGNREELSCLRSENKEAINELKKENKKDKEMFVDAIESFNKAIDKFNFTEKRFDRIETKVEGIGKKVEEIQVMVDDSCKK